MTKELYEAWIVNIDKRPSNPDILLNEDDDKGLIVSYTEVDRNPSDIVKSEVLSIADNYFKDEMELSENVTESKSEIHDSPEIPTVEGSPDTVNPDESDNQGASNTNDC